MTCMLCGPRETLYSQGIEVVLFEQLAMLKLLIIVSHFFQERA